MTIQKISDFQGGNRQIFREVLRTFLGRSIENLQSRNFKIILEKKFMGVSKNFKFSFLQEMIQKKKKKTGNGLYKKQEI